MNYPAWPVRSALMPTKLYRGVSFGAAEPLAVNFPVQVGPTPRPTVPGIGLPPLRPGMMFTPGRVPPGSSAALPTSRSPVLFLPQPVTPAPVVTGPGTPDQIAAAFQAWLKSEIRWNALHTGRTSSDLIVVSARASANNYRTAFLKLAGLADPSQQPQISAQQLLTLANQAAAAGGPSTMVADLQARAAALPAGAGVPTGGGVPTGTTAPAGGGTTPANGGTTPAKTPITSNPYFNGALLASPILLGILLGEL